MPVKIDIIKHQHEIDGKSTAGHAAILAPEDVNVYTYPNIPNYTKEKVVLIFPSQKAISITQLIHSINSSNQNKLTEYQEAPVDELPSGYNKTTLVKIISKSPYECEIKNFNRSLPIEKAIFIDSTWNQSKSIYKDERLKNIPTVVIQNRISQFWRHQKGSPRWYLSTIEAIHQFFIEIHLHCWGLNPNYKGIANCFTEKTIEQFHLLYNDSEESYNGQYDNLLFFFRHMYELIHTYYQHDELYAYKRRLL